MRGSTIASKLIAISPGKLSVVDLSNIRVAKKLIERLQKLESNLKAMSAHLRERSSEAYTVISDHIEKTNSHITDIFLLVKEAHRKRLQATQMWWAMGQ